MPTAAACDHCGHVSYLPDGWTSPGFTCPACRRPSAAPLVHLPSPMLIVAPPAADPLDFAEPRASVRVTHHYDHTPQRNSFTTGFGGALGQMLGVAAGFVVLIGLVVLVLASTGAFGRR